MFKFNENIFIFLLIILISFSFVDTNLSEAFAETKVIEASLEVKPNEACNLLLSNGFKTGGWKNDYDDDFGCNSPYITFGLGSPQNNIAYYVEGSSKVVKKLKLVVNINYRNEAKMAHAKLLEAASELFKKVMYAPINPEIAEAITKGESFILNGEPMIQIYRDDWPTGKGYELQFIIHP